MRVSLAISVDLMQRVKLTTNVSASVSDGGIFVNHNLILGVRSKTFKVNFAGNSIARVLVHLNGTIISLTTNTMEFTDSIYRLFKRCDDIANIGRRIFFKRRVP